MATGMLPFQPVVIRAASTPADDRKPEPRKSNNWFAPLFGFSSEPDYLNTAEKKTGPARSRFEPGSFTEEKAKRLRRMTADGSASHEMYHSAIASRLASDFSDRK